MDSPPDLGPLGKEPLLVRYGIISDGDDLLNKILQCLQAPGVRSFNLRLRATDTGEEFVMNIGRLTSVEHDTDNPGIVHFASPDGTGNTVTAYLNHLTNEPDQQIGFATIGMRL